MLRNGIDEAEAEMENKRLILAVDRLQFRVRSLD